MVHGHPVSFWLWLFYQCFEWHFDGGQVTSKSDDRYAIRTGYYHRLEWPHPGGVMFQCWHIVEIFNIIKDEESRLQASKAK